MRNLKSGAPQFSASHCIAIRSERDIEGSLNLTVPKPAPSNRYVLRLARSVAHHRIFQPAFFISKQPENRLSQCANLVRVKIALPSLFIQFRLQSLDIRHQKIVANQLRKIAQISRHFSQSSQASFIQSSSRRRTGTRSNRAFIRGTSFHRPKPKLSQVFSRRDYICRPCKLAP